MLDPQHFRVNQAWLVFQLNDWLLRINNDGDYDNVVLMDVASFYILSFTLVPVDSGRISKNDADCLLREGHAQKNELPETLYVSDRLSTLNLLNAAKALGITAVKIPEL